MRREVEDRRGYDPDVDDVRVNPQAVGQRGEQPWRAEPAVASHDDGLPRDARAERHAERADDGIVQITICDAADVVFAEAAWVHAS
jgi:hypothetical protein